MNNENNHTEKAFKESVKKKSQRKLNFRKKDERGLLYGFGMFGLVGWSVAIPTLVLLALGIWIDSTFKGPYSWTLMLLVLGIMIGCINAWYWVKKESENGT
ncbi:AtpZ/AtpI family protein [Fodinibius saliphilus]|uniref:AtpZ/AtpI family protein n=1 Tax=Fodinibius saliphilus TaxID=1920650 RepID=UPI001108D6BE|nr:AtpZ/AtpI family protein [Fodinibius saliphilus]